MNYAVQEIPPLMLVAARCLLGGSLLALGVLLLGRGGTLRDWSRGWAFNAVIGAILFLGGHGLQFSAQRVAPSGLTALAGATMSFWFVVLPALGRRRWPKAPMLAGVVAGMVGVGLLGSFAARPDPAGALMTPGVFLLLLGAGFAWAVGSMLARRGGGPGDLLLAATQQMAAGGMLALLLSGLMGEWEGWTLSALTPRGLAALGYLVVIGTALAFGIYSWLLRATAPERVGTFAFVNPVVALLLGVLVAGERLTPPLLLAAVLILAGVVVLWRQSNREVVR